uniref:Uncharacterized protein n=1 Tax=Anguilla anguilla TaxID=7936 RepID=A0A0E9T392_ANGAN
MGRASCLENPACIQRSLGYALYI